MVEVYMITAMHKLTFHIPSQRLILSNRLSTYISFSIYSSPLCPKVIEQLHLITRKVLRVYPSVRCASRFLGVDKSNVSHACHGITTTAYGFRWRFRESNYVDWEGIKDQQMSLEQLQSMRIIKVMF